MFFKIATLLPKSSHIKDRSLAINRGSIIRNTCVIYMQVGFLILEVVAVLW